MTFQPIDRPVCSGCGRPEQGYYQARDAHMAAAFRSGVPVRAIAAAYGISQDWAMKVIQEQLGRESMGELIKLFMVGACEICGDDIEPGQEIERIDGRALHARCVEEAANA